MRIEGKFPQGSKFSYWRLKLVPRYWSMNYWPPTDPSGWAHVQGFGPFRFMYWRKDSN